MVDHKFNNHLEIENYAKILNRFKENASNHSLDETWEYQSYIKLAEILERNQNKNIFSNSIIIMVALFGDLPPDVFNSIGKKINKISKNDKNIALKILKNEFHSYWIQIHILQLRPIFF